MVANKQEKTMLYLRSAQLLYQQLEFGAAGISSRIIMFQGDDLRLLEALNLYATVAVPLLDYQTIPHVQELDFRNFLQVAVFLRLNAADPVERLFPLLVDTMINIYIVYKSRLPIREDELISWLGSKIDGKPQTIPKIDFLCHQN
jgi:hypothetical protein